MMKIHFKIAVITALLLGSSLTQAALTTSSIPMAIAVPESCVFSNISPGIILPEDGGEVEGGVSVKCNTEYSINMRMASQPNGSYESQVVNANGVGLKTTAVVYGSTFTGSFSTPLTVIYGYLSSRPTDDYRVRVKLKSPVTAHTPEGVYTDTMHFDVNY